MVCSLILRELQVDAAASPAEALEPAGLRGLTARGQVLPEGNSSEFEKLLVGFFATEHAQQMHLLAPQLLRLPPEHPSPLDVLRESVRVRLASRPTALRTTCSAGGHRMLRGSSKTDATPIQREVNPRNDTLTAQP